MRISERKQVRSTMANTTKTKTEEGETGKLSDFFSKIWSNYEFLESTDLASTDAEYQRRVSESIENTEKAIHMTNLLHLFSDNEDIDEVSTPSLKYLLLPALLNYFTMRKVGGERLDLVKKAKDLRATQTELLNEVHNMNARGGGRKAYIKDFMRLCALYNLTSIKLDDKEDEEENSEKNGKEITKPFPTKKEPDLLGMANQRQNKIDRYKEQKKTLQEIKELRVHIEKEHVEEEVQRKYYLLLLKNWISTALDDFENIKMELEILEQMAALKAKGIDIAEEKKSGGINKRKPFRPFIITKDQLQKKVIGAGYPSLPTLTVEEFYEQKVKDGTFQLPTGSSLQDWAKDPDKTSKDKEEEETNDEEKIEKDDVEKLSKMRNWDDWKDDVRRGDGNRMNMG